MLIKKSNFNTDILSGKVVLITGAGGGIGFEAARALAYLGADVVIAEIDKEKGELAQNKINYELSSNNVFFYHLDIADEKHIDCLYEFVMDKYGFLDILFHNATITPMGAVDSVRLSDWDNSYAVNLRAPVYLTQKFLPKMKEKNSGTIVFVPSSGAAPYMGAYEVFKTAQVELCNTLAGELEGTNIITYSIGPGLVITETAEKAIQTVSSLMNMTISEFYELNEKHILDVETAGVGFAVSVVNAKRYNGLEISSIQALMDAGMFERENKVANSNPLPIDTDKLSHHIKNIVNTFNEQYNGWLQRNLFERQWVLRDFKKTVGMSVDSFKLIMSNVLDLTNENYFDSIAEHKPQLEKLRMYYIHQHKLLQSYEKNPEQLKESSQAIMEWVDELDKTIRML